LIKNFAFPQPQRDLHQNFIKTALNLRSSDAVAFGKNGFVNNGCNAANNTTDFRTDADNPEKVSGVSTQ
jgi:hypothetical protein